MSNLVLLKEKVYPKTNKAIVAIQNSRAFPFQKGYYALVEQTFKTMLNSNDNVANICCTASGMQQMMSILAEVIRNNGTFGDGGYYVLPFGNKLTLIPSYKFIATVLAKIGYTITAEVIYNDELDSYENINGVINHNLKTRLTSKIDTAGTKYKLFRDFIENEIAGGYVIIKDKQGVVVLSEQISQSDIMARVIWEQNRKMSNNIYNEHKLPMLKKVIITHSSVKMQIKALIENYNISNEFNQGFVQPTNIMIDNATPIYDVDKLENGDIKGAFDAVSYEYPSEEIEQTPADVLDVGATTVPAQPAQPVGPKPAKKEPKKDKPAPVNQDTGFAYDDYSNVDTNPKNDSEVIIDEPVQQPTTAPTTEPAGDEW